MCDILSCTLDQESFALVGFDRNSVTNIPGMIQIYSESLNFTPPATTKVHLIGKEQLGNSCYDIMNDTYHVSNSPIDWQTNLDSATPAYNLPFSLPVSNSIPTSFQIYDQQEDFVCCRIFYTLEIEVSSMEQTVVIPIYFHKSRNIEYKNTPASLQDIENEAEEDIPKKVFWGTTKQCNRRWQYELEFPHMFDLANRKSGSISLRLRSLTGHKKETNYSCCLIGCQIIQIMHLKGYEDRIQVLATATQLLTKPNSSWLKPCQLDFDLEEAILPTIESYAFNVVHYIRVTVEFCNEINEFGRCCLDLQFPVVFTGCAVGQQIPIRKPVMEKATNGTLASSPTSFSSSSKTVKSDNYNLPFTHTSFYVGGECRAPCLRYLLAVQG